ncbi:MAG: hypothetical protein MUO31_13200 [Thermodesulfovibrionales bacterium]|nr:hypothetical protein [Thermodesulfovibrionales bacterium]
MTKEEAITLAGSGFWEHLTSEEIAKFQLFEDKLCMPFGVFHQAIEEALGRPVYTHEFGLNREGLEKELIGEAEPPTLQEIMELIPEEKRIIIVTEC